LWWQGEDVAADRVRRSLVRTVAKTSKARQSALARQTDDEEWARFDQKNRRRLGDDDALAAVQERMDKGRFVQVQKSLQELTTGTLDRRDIEETRSAFRQAFGRVMSSQAFDVEAISPLSNPDGWRVALNRSSNDDLVAARQELRAFIAQLFNVCANNPELSLGGFPANVAAIMLSLISQDLPRELYLIWLASRQHTAFRVLFQFFMQTLQLPVAEWPKVVPPTDAAGLL
jgi:hypothetical protein